MLETESSDEVQELKIQMHIAEVDLNYTQYHPLTETYIGLYPQKDGESDGSDSKQGVMSKPPMWAEVEKCMEEGTLGRLRNRSSNIAIKPPKKLEIKPPKSKPQSGVAEVNSMNRRERRSKGQGVKKTKNSSTGFEKNRIFGALEVARGKGGKEKEEEEESDGGFFEE